MVYGKIDDFSASFIIKCVEFARDIKPAVCLSLIGSKRNKYANRNKYIMVILPLRKRLRNVSVFVFANTSNVDLSPKNVASYKITVSMYR